MSTEELLGERATRLGFDLQSHFLHLRLYRNAEQAATFDTVRECVKFLDGYELAKQERQ